jgi:tetratricopeptide (TPR) repeat protein
MTRKHILLIIILAALVYINALYGNFVYDDSLFIVDNGFIKSARNIPLLFSRRYFTHPLEAAFNVGSYNMGSGETTYRPVTTLSYFLNFAVFGLDPFGWRLANLAIHILCAVLVYLLLNKLFAKPRPALFSALLFGLQPVNAPIVNCTVFRSNSLAFLFCLLAIALYFRFKQAQDKQDKYKYIYLASSLVSFFLGVFSKEIAFVLPFALILCDYYRLKFDLPKLLRNFKIYSLYFLIDAIYIFIYFVLMPPNQNIINDAPVSAGLIRMLNVLGIYLKGVFFPLYILPIDPSEIPIAYSTEALPGIIALISSIYVVLKRNKLPAEISFAVIWFWLWLLPMNNFLNSFRINAAYHYLYPAVPGLAVLGGFALDRIWQAKTKMAVLQRLAPVACLGYFAIFTVSANASWKSDMMLNMLIVDKNPDSVYAHVNLGSILLKYGDIPEAKKELSFILRRPRFLKEGPLWESIAYSNLGSIYIEEGRYPKAEAMFRQALQLTPHVAYLHAKVGFCYMKQGMYKEALDYFNQAKKINPLFSPAYLNTGVTYLIMGKYEQAKSEFTRALKIKPDYKEAQDNLKKIAGLEKGKRW